MKMMMRMKVDNRKVKDNIQYTHKSFEITFTLAGAMEAVNSELLFVPKLYGGNWIRK
jgi:hypothetical protein